MKASTPVVHVGFVDALSKGPPPPGNLAVPIFSHGSLVVELYTPVGSDPQKPHSRDEIYISSLAGVVSSSMGSGVIRLGLVHFYSFQPARFTASRTSHPTSRFGSYFMDRKEERPRPDKGIQ
jgi:hypothetical protein